MKKNTLLITLILAILSIGCVNTHRLDGGTSATYGKDPETGLAVGTETSAGGFDLFGSLFRFRPYVKRTGLASSIDEPTVASGTSAASDTAAQALKAEMEREPGTGKKRVTYGATGLSTEAQKLDSILREIERIKNGLPHKVDRTEDTPTPSPEE